ncbi:UDP-N-acetylmuramate--alanine ligase [Alkaliphilus metalliredigens QYMF]|uniref:UDP-N-acetylmuramate--L-alanine ligase n=1 Tax=Alkaliphilus metalliredigens (strain QYMF) TaxID=293826 RepID=MURC_ALKMQ|nr:RecName: Full=UDP-N-acetylmuramate--L-alanine ligase; AltName: Full=UDP-N-acetylmuramoyl-L-alanine synthetase [Alkaliphilus metalliredigens QYMF]ABR46390.1 UDP-N-acetylmuramate--alanine ligase [Alkaliphilus metalliredigens QYMF]
MIAFNMDEHQLKHIHLIGIGGISMSAIAEILLENGYHISGSDMKESNLTHKLRDHGAEIFIGHASENIQNPDLVVYTAAVKADNPERIRAEELGIPLADRAEMLGQIMKKYEKAIAVAGSHGKTTTTSLISLLMEYSNLDPTILVGGELDEIGGNIKIGQSQHFITEACEYVESFLKFYPFIGIILNIDEDHLDYFKDIEHIKSAFKKFAQRIPKEGFLIASYDDAHVREISRDLDCHVITYGIKTKSQFMAHNIEFSFEGLPSFDVSFEGKTIGSFSLNIPGLHNVYNSLAAIATTYVLGVDPVAISKHITRFKGIHRRFDLLGEVKGAKVIDDYAHHPVEIRATLEAAKKYPHKKIWCVFQPHTYSRTQALLKDFAKSFYLADHVIITDIYAAREKDEGIVNSQGLVNLIVQEHPAQYIGGFEEISRYLYDHIEAGDIVLTMGAGDVYLIAQMLLAEK